jgi:hypothetical protein
VNESPSIFARTRAGLAGLLGGIGSGFHWLEDRTSRGMRPWLLGLVALAVAAFVIVGAVHEWHHGGPHGFGDRDAAHHVGPPPPGPKPDGKPEGKPEGRPDARGQGGPAAKPQGGPAEKPHGGPLGGPGAPAPPPPPPPPGSASTAPS